MAMRVLRTAGVPRDVAANAPLADLLPAQRREEIACATAPDESGSDLALALGRTSTGRRETFWGRGSECSSAFFYRREAPSQ